MREKETIQEICCNHILLLCVCEAHMPVFQFD